MTDAQPSRNPGKLPLVELMAQVCWASTARTDSGAPAMSPVLGAPPPEFSPGMPEDLAAALAALGFSRTSTPWPGAPLAGSPAAAAWRWHSAQADDPRFYQLEASRFQAVSSPPRHRWADVERFIGDGVEALLASHVLSAQARAPLSPRLDYQDVFDDQAGGVPGFLARTCGIELPAPTWLHRYASPDAQARTSWCCSAPMPGDMQLDIEVTADAADPHRIFVRSGVAATAPVAPRPAAFLAFFDTAHDAVHRLYLDMHESGA